MSPAQPLHTDYRPSLDRGVDVRLQVQGKTPVDWLLQMYTRSDGFAGCLRLLLDRGGLLPDPVVAPVLLNDTVELKRCLREMPSLLTYRTSLVSAFSPLIGVPLLHVAAEYGHQSTARVLLEAGADVNARAAYDANGFNGHTALFHTVNSHNNRSGPLCDLLLEFGADPDVRLEGIVWGRGFDWETTCFDVTPTSYAQLGLLPQMHRREEDVYAIIGRLRTARGLSAATPDNVPNRYLRPRAR